MVGFNGILTWQMHDQNEWRFGQLVRGAVRQPYLAEIYYDEDRGWIWLTHPAPKNIFHSCGPRGVEASFAHALDAAEAVLREYGWIPQKDEELPASMLSGDKHSHAHCECKCACACHSTHTHCECACSPNHPHCECEGECERARNSAPSQCLEACAKGVGEANSAPSQCLEACAKGGLKGSEPGETSDYSQFP